MRANSVPGGTIREGALFFQTVAAGGGGGALFKRGHYSRGGTIQEGALFKRGHYSREYGTLLLQELGHINFCFKTHASYINQKIAVINLASIIMLHVKPAVYSVNTFNCRVQMERSSVIQ